MARTKFVHPTDMVAHLWAHQTQESARNPHGNFYFEGATIYSYGSHFPIARHVGDAKTILFTTQTYSSTTSGHISCVRSAMAGLKRVFYVHNVLASAQKEHRENHDEMLKEIEDCRLSFANSIRNKSSELKQWLAAIEQANDYSFQFKLKRKRIKLTVTKAMKNAVKISDEKLCEHAFRVETKRAARHAQLMAENAEAEKARLAADEEWQREREALWTAWLRGEGPTSALKDRYQRPVQLRVISEGTERDGGFLEQSIVETTLGAIVPLEDVRKAFVIWSMCTRKKQEWHRNGEQIKVGDFQLDSISEDGNVIAGCHRIHCAEVERFAQSQGWLEKAEA